jgi:hypothetical protein
VPGEKPKGADSLILPGDYLPRQVLVGAEGGVGGGGSAGGGGGAFGVALGSSHSLALVRPHAFHRCPSSSSIKAL